MASTNGNPSAAFARPGPARTEDPSSLAHHPEEEGTLFGPFEHSRRGHTRVTQLSEGRAEG